MFCGCPIEDPMFFGGDEFARTVDIGAVQDEYGSWLREQFKKEAAEIAAGMPAEDAEDFDAEEVLGVRYDEYGDGSMWGWLSERYDACSDKAIEITEKHDITYAPRSWVVRAEFRDVEVGEHGRRPGWHKICDGVEWHFDDVRVAHSFFDEPESFEPLGGFPVHSYLDQVAPDVDHGNVCVCVDIAYEVTVDMLTSETKTASELAEWDSDWKKIVHFDDGYTESDVISDGRYCEGCEDLLYEDSRRWYLEGRCGE